MNFLALLNNQIVQKVLFALGIVSTVLIVYYKINSVYKENELLKSQKIQLETLVATLKGNIEQEKILCEEKIKTNSFNTIVKETKEIIQSKIDEFKPKEIKPIPSKKEIKNVIENKTINDNDIVHFQL